MVCADFLATAAGSLASPTPRVVPDLKVSSISVVLSFMAMVRSSTSWGSQVHQVTRGSRESGRGRPPARYLQFGSLTPASVSIHTFHPLQVHQHFQGDSSLGRGRPPRGSGRSSPVFWLSTRGRPWLMGICMSLPLAMVLVCY